MEVAGVFEPPAVGSGNFEKKHISICYNLGPPRADPSVEKYGPKTNKSKPKVATVDMATNLYCRTATKL